MKLDYVNVSDKNAGKTGGLNLKGGIPKIRWNHTPLHTMGEFNYDGGLIISLVIQTLIKPI